MNTTELSKICRQVRRDIITMTANSGSGHPGGSLSAVELMTSVFYNHMRLDPKNPKWDGRDRFVLSKGAAHPPRGCSAAPQVRRHSCGCQKAPPAPPARRRL